MKRKRGTLRNDNNISLYVFISDHLFVLSCQWNYCTDHCRKGKTESKCLAAEKYGVRILHGIRHAFENKKQPAFMAVYEAFEQVSRYEQWSTNPNRHWNVQTRINTEELPRINTEVRNWISIDLWTRLSTDIQTRINTEVQSQINTGVQTRIYTEVQTPINNEVQTRINTDV